MVSSSSTTRSEIVGWMAGSKLDEMASSEHLRKPKKARINMASSVWGRCGQNGSLCGGWKCIWSKFLKLWAAWSLGGWDWFFGYL